MSQRLKSLSKWLGFKRSLPLIDDNRNQVLSKSWFDLCVFMRQNEGGKQ